MMKRNPYLGQTVDPYHGAEWIDTNLPIPDVSRHTLDVQGQTIDQYGHRLMEPRGANAHTTHHVPPPPSVSMPSTATSATPGDMPLASELTGTAYHHEHSLAQTVVGVAALAGATYAVVQAADTYIGDSRERYLRWMKVWTVIYLVVLLLPFVAMSVFFTEPSFLWLSTPFLLILGLGWAMVPGQLRTRFPEQQSTAIQATHRRP